ncbi:TonB family protein [Sphingomonas baiyangensis]|uniref:Protein TonB n=2 Tax=Sphingomonas baiyangensis TaxID=2572576 RepID=A0A4U1L5V4_9SPHN|nr:TonB family protein [Sphingomonas baiyangensis]
MPRERTERVEPMPAPLPYRPDPRVDLPAPDRTDLILAPLPPAPIPFDTGNIGNATMPAAEPSPVAPVMTGAEIDPRFAGRFQPDYPAAERRAEISGRVTVRVRVGADGRVKAVERIAAASDGLFEATRRQALSAWRFRPATSDGVAIESWKVMTVRFELE